MIYSSRRNQIVKDINALKDKKFRELSGQYLVEGVKMVNEAIKYGLPIDKIVATEDALSKLTESDFETLTVTEDVFSFLSDCKNPQGALAVLNMPKVKPEKPLKSCLLLDGVRDPGNLGAIIRTAAASGYNDIYLVSCCDPYNPKVIRSSMSGIYFVNLYEVSYEEACEVLANVPLIVGDMNGTDVFKFVPPKNYCVVIGNEANGVSDFLRKRANYTVKIPMDEKMESLNAGISCAVLMYQLKYSKGE